MAGERHTIVTATPETRREPHAEFNASMIAGKDL